MNDDAASGIHFIVSRGSKRGKKEDRNSIGSVNSMNSMSQLPAMSRVASVTSVLKRLFSRDDQNRMPTTPNTQIDGGGILKIIMPLKVSTDRMENSSRAFMSKVEKRAREAMLTPVLI